jgi:hypothetical protein
LGVVDVPYTLGRATTGDVANWLENKYHIMELMYETHQTQIADDLANSVRGALETLMSGGPAAVDPFAAAGDDIRRRFDDFIALGEVEWLGIPGVPTKAALAGKSSRFKKKRNPRGRRPSFIDTGLYLQSFRAWVDYD